MASSKHERLFCFKKIERFATKPFIFHRVNEEIEEVFTYADILIELLKFRQLLVTNEVPSNIGIVLNISEHTPALFAALLGILNHNCYFCPLMDSGFSKSNNNHINRLDSKFILCDIEAPSEYYEIVFQYTLANVKLFLYKVGAKKNSGRTYVESICYAISTSGSTGTPKIVVVPYSCIAVNVEALSVKLNLSSNDVIMMYAPISFDPFVIEFFCALHNGAALIVTPKTFRLSSKLRYLLSNSTTLRGATVLQMTPSLFRLFLAPYFEDLCLKDSNSLRVLLLGGEKFPSQEEWGNWLPKNMLTRKLHIYNIYGITEVSCWSTIHEWSENDKFVPLGIAIESTTELRIVDEERKPLFGKGKGELQIGSSIRKCFVEGQDELGNDTLMCFRNTGDLVERVENSNLLYIGRLNNTIKRFGKLIYLDGISETIEQILQEFKMRAVLIFDEICSELLAYIELPKKKHISLEQKCRILIMENLQNYEKPDKITFVDHFPITEHGKIDRHKLRKIFDTSAHTRRKPVEKFKIFLEETLGWKYFETDVNQENMHVKNIICSSFIDAGGTSFNALSLAMEIGADLIQAKDQKTLLDLLLNANVTIKEIIKFLDKAVVKECIVIEKLPRIHDKSQQLKLLWNADLKKCVDASPLYCSKQKCICVGSHACIVYTLNASTGVCMTALNLPDRIEGKVKFVSNIALVGCYNGHLYAFNFKIGKIEWEFDVGGMIKTQPVVSEDSVIVASYASDYNLTCVSLKNCILKWHQRIGEKGILVTPILLLDKTLIVCTLDGTYARIYIADGKIIWLRQLKSPIFSQSAVAFDETVIFIAEVDGQVHACNISNGKIIASFTASGNIFSGITVVTRDAKTLYIIFGCHDHNVYCLKYSNSNNLILLHWKSHLQSPIYATPKIIRNHLKNDICVASTKGLVIILDLSTGYLKAKYDLKADVFSTPCIADDDNKIFIGCRDNYVYCLSLQ